MPERDYSKGKIYRIYCITGECNDVYVGSTIQSLAKRWGEHKTESKRSGNRRIFQAIAGNWKDWKIELVELCPCSSKMELQKREGEIIKETGTLNMQIAGRSKKDYQQENAEIIRERVQKYTEANREKIRQREREQYQKHKDDRAPIRARQRRERYDNTAREKKKQYCIDNAEKIKENKARYYAENAELFKEKRKQYCKERAEYFKSLSAP